VPVIGVLALQGDAREHVRALQDAGAEARPVRRLPEIEAADGLVIPGGESTTLWRLAVAFDLLDPIRKLIADGMPAFGSCAGMIMLADRLLDGAPGQRAFGGIDMTVRRNAFGRQVDSFEREVMFDGAPFHAVFIRAPWVEQAGPGVSVLGRMPGGAGIPPATPLRAPGAAAPAGRRTAGIVGVSPAMPWEARGAAAPGGDRVPDMFASPSGAPRGVRGVAPPGDNSRIIGVRQGALLATAFHPELTPDRRVHELFVSIVKGTS
jgi:pyridoxal 5'-phosphate synthase pdxT subunit